MVLPFQVYSSMATPQTASKGAMVEVQCSVQRAKYRFDDEVDFSLVRALLEALLPSQLPGTSCLSS